MIEVAGDFLRELGQSRDADQAFEALLDFSLGLGFDCALAGELRTAARGQPPVLLDCRVRAFTDEFEDYMARGSFQHDPLFADFFRASRPFVNGPEDLRAAETTPEQRALLDYEMIATKTRLTLPPIRGAGGSVWAMSFGRQELGRPMEGFLGEVSTAIWLAASAAALRMSELGRAAPEAASPLTPRERECLTRLAAGDRVDRIADRLSLSNATVELHLANARRRLGARTSAEAVAKAVLNGWIAP